LPHAIQFSLQLYRAGKRQKDYARSADRLSVRRFYFGLHIPASDEHLPRCPPNTETALQDLPLIVATPDGGPTPMGCLTPPDASRACGAPRPYIYGQFPVEELHVHTPVQSHNEMEHFVRTGPVAAATTLNFRTFVIAGTLDDVKSTMTQLYLKKQAGTL
jgi:hypothetical protein